MSELHAATSGPKAREIVDTVLAEFDRWSNPNQAAGMNPNDSYKAAQAALYDVRTDLDDHLVVGIGLVLASWGLSDEQ